jgi:hypothetical protein
MRFYVRWLGGDSVSNVSKSSPDWTLYSHFEFLKTLSYWSQVRLFLPFVMNLLTYELMQLLSSKRPGSHINSNMVCLFSLTLCVKPAKV